MTDLQITREENYPELDVVVDRAEGRHAGPLRAAGRADRADQPGGQHPVRADPVHRREDRQRVLHQRPAGRRLPVATSTTCRDMFMRTPGGGMVPLDTIAHVERGSGPVHHQPQVPAAHHRRRRRTSRRARTWAAASAAVQRVLDELPPPDGFTVRLGGQTEAQQQAFGDLTFAARAGDRARLHGAGVAVQVADRSAGDHVQRAAGRDAACSWRCG